ncbi:TlpA disulfide reductase family protein [Hallella sp.]|uniref:TlpA disulfide reductase family protein n=1 Tax=Hallella TaxID=52228 RepID=UPI00284D5C4A|nr:TlpA disulfide reductase family protein [Hallella sp.]MBS7399197.1 redoxin domain-containing protein [Prevotella sp.]MDR3844800.1 TlpA disulfide reductase family protein [Hallella sp.]MDR4000237.1 TlpA disulfide reductase family protein [Hallella sp.]
MMMKRFMLAVSCLSLSACMMADDLHVSGNLSDVGNDTLIAMTYLNNSVDQTMKVVGKDGAFDFHMDVKEPAPLVLQVRHPLKDGQQPMAAYAVLMAVPGENLKVTGSFSNYQVDGSAFYKDFEQCRKVSASFEEGVKNLQRDYSAKMEQGANPDSLEKVINKAYEELKANLSDATLKYIKAHPDMEACVSMLDNVDVENYKEVLAALSPAVREGRMKGLVDHFADYAQKALEREAAKKNTVEGNVAPDFTLKSIDGKNISLSSLKGKVVVLDFWGSWCGWCIKGMPKMKEYYAKYKGKLEILGIDCNDTEQKWRDAVKKHELPWLHVRNEGNPDVTVLYGISGFPTKIVIDAEGKISKVVVGESEDFYTYLDQLLGK